MKRTAKKTWFVLASLKLTALVILNQNWIKLFPGHSNLCWFQQGWLRILQENCKQQTSTATTLLISFNCFGIGLFMIINKCWDTCGTCFLQRSRYAPVSIVSTHCENFSTEGTIDQKGQRSFLPRIYYKITHCYNNLTCIFLNTNRNSSQKPLLTLWE